jgi:DNA replication protein DnaC
MSIGFTTAAALVNELMEARVECGATLITSYLPLYEWTETFRTKRLTGERR